MLPVLWNLAGILRNLAERSQFRLNGSRLLGLSWGLGNGGGFWFVQDSARVQEKVRGAQSSEGRRSGVRDSKELQCSPVSGCRVMGWEVSREQTRGFVAE